MFRAVLLAFYQLGVESPSYPSTPMGRSLFRFFWSR
jgi:hypothetical protein